MTNTIPTVNVDKKLLQDIEATYEHLLLTPLSQINKTDAPLSVPSLPDPVVARAPAAIPPRLTGISGKQTVQTYAGAAGNDDELLSMLALYHYLQASQIATLLQKETSLNHIRAKLKRLVEIDGLVETVSLPRSSQSGGKTPFLYTLSVKGIKYLNDQYRAGLAIPVGTRKHGRLEHTRAVNDLLIATALLPCSDPKLSIVDFRHERFLKTTPVHVAMQTYLVPDGFVQLRFHHQEYGYFLEIDCNSEDAATIAKKAQLYVKAAQDILQQQFSCAAFRVVFCVVQGGESRAKQVTRIIESALGDNEDDGELFFIGNVPEHIAPVALFTTAPFAVPFDRVTQTLLTM